MEGGPVSKGLHRVAKALGRLSEIILTALFVWISRHRAESIRHVEVALGRAREEAVLMLGDAPKHRC